MASRNNHNWAQATKRYSIHNEWDSLLECDY